jgi:hypothetical protein
VPYCLGFCLQVIAWKQAGEKGKAEVCLRVRHFRSGGWSSRLDLFTRDVTSGGIRGYLLLTIFQFIILTFVYSSTCFGRFLAHHQELNDCSGNLWFYLCIVVIVVLCSAETATTVIELLMMGGKTPETC